MQNTDKMIMASYIQYKRLRELINHAFSGSSANKVNLFIDMYSATAMIYSPQHSPSTNAFTITATIVNMCAHYRHFFRSRLGVETEIYIVMSNNIQTDNHIMMPSWNYKHDKDTKEQYGNTEMLRSNIEILTDLVPYLPNIHMAISGGYETASIIASIIEGYAENIPNIIISRDEYMYQLPSLYINTCVLRPYKGSTQPRLNNEIPDQSYALGPFYSHDDIMTFWKHITNNTKIDYPIHPVNAPYIWAMAGMKQRSIKPLVGGYKTPFGVVYNAVGDEPIKCSIDTLYKAFPDLEGAIPRAIMTTRVHCFDASFQKMVYQHSPEYPLMISMLKRDIDDPEQVKEINGKFFYDCPLDLEKL